MSLLLTSEAPAEHLKPLAESLLAADKLTLRQYRAWCLKHFTPMSLYAIQQQMIREGFTGHGGRPIALATVKKALHEARRIIDAEYLTELEESEGRIQFAVVVTHGHQTRLATDTTAQAAHQRLGLGIRARETEHFALAA